MGTLNNKKSDIDGGSSQALFLFALSMLAVIGLLLRLDRLKYPLVEFHLRGSGIAATLKQGFTLLGPLDYALGMCVVLLIVACLYLEARRRALSVSLIRASSAQMLGVLLILLVWFSHAYLYPGYLLAGDVGSHIARTAHFRMGLEQGQAIFWDNYFYLGSPFLQFTGPFYFWISGVADLILREPNLTTKLLLFVLRIAGGVFVYLFMVRQGVSRFACMISAIAYSGAFAYTHLLLWKGALPQAITLALLPLSFLLLEQALRAQARFGVAWAGFTLVNAVLFVNHQATGMMAGLFIAFYVLANLFLRRYEWQRVWLLAVSGGGSIAISVFVIVPILAEKQWVMMYSEPRLIEFVLPSLAYFKQLLVWHNTYHGAGAGSAGYLGLTAALLAAWGVYRLLAAGRADPLRAFGLAILMCFALSLTVRGAHVRDIIFTLFFISALAGVGTHFLLNRVSAKSRLPFLLLGLLLLDSGSTAIQPLSRTDKAYLDIAARHLLETAPAQRILLTNMRDSQLTASIGPGGPPLHYYPLQQVIGAHSLTATLAHNYLAASIKMAERDLRRDGQLSQTSATALAMLNVGRVINDRGSALGFPAKVHGTVVDGPLGRVLKIDAATPLIYSAAIRTVDIAPGLDKPVAWNDDFDGKQPSGQGAKLFDALQFMVEQTGYDSSTRSAQRILVRAGETGKHILQRAPSNSADWSGRVMAYHVGLSDIALEVESGRDGYLQLSHPWYPYARVDWNGQRIAPMQGYTNLMVVPVRAGVNRYAITFERSPLRIASGWFSLAILVVVLGLMVAGWLRNRGQTQAAGLRES